MIYIHNFYIKSYLTMHMFYFYIYLFIKFLYNFYSACLKINILITFETFEEYYNMFK